MARVITVAAGKGDILERREPKFVLVNCVKLARGAVEGGNEGGEEEPASIVKCCVRLKPTLCDFHGWVVGDVFEPEV